MQQNDFRSSFFKYVARLAFVREHHVSSEISVSQNAYCTCKRIYRASETPGLVYFFFSDLELQYTLWQGSNSNCN